MAEAIPYNPNVANRQMHTHQLHFSTIAKDIREKETFTALSTFSWFCTNKIGLNIDLLSFQLQNESFNFSIEFHLLTKNVEFANIYKKIFTDL